MYEPVTERGKALLERLKKAGIDGEEDRWSEGIDHHKRSDMLVRDLAEIDWMFFGDSFGFKVGGDGDNGEILMYELDILFALYDAEFRSKVNIITEIQDVSEKGDMRYE
jgi:hypothetical protein